MSDLLTTTELVRFTCWCGLPFALPRHLYNHCKDESNRKFYCPVGHAIVFPKSRQHEIDDLLLQLQQRDNALAAERGLRERI